MPVVAGSAAPHLKMDSKMKQSAAWTDSEPNFHWSPPAVFGSKLVVCDSGRPSFAQRCLWTAGISDFTFA